MSKWDPKDVVPYGDRVFIKLAKKESITNSGIILMHTETGNNKEEVGTIFSVSPTLEDKDIESGQHVVFEKFAGWELAIGDDDYRVIQLDNIIAFLNKPEETK